MDDGKCYAVESWQDCSATLVVTVLEAYDDCISCVCTLLTDCADGVTTLLTYADLRAYAIGSVIRRASDGKCFTLTSTASWDPTAVGFDIESSHPDCDTCQQTAKYLLEHICEPSECDSGGGSMPDIVTTEDLHAAIGMFVSVAGHCYQVSAGTGTVTNSTLEYQGPFSTCGECVVSPLNSRKRRVTRVYFDTTNHKIVAEVEEDVIQNGLIVGTCRLSDETVAETADCPPSS